jgi:hypothetical protein
MLRSVCLTAGFLAALAGCGDGGPRRVTVRGTITFDGQPLPAGDVFFIDDGGGTRTDAGKIAAGNYSVTTTPGPKRVRVQASVQDGPIDPVMKMRTWRDYIPDRYNNKSTLKVDVTPSGPNTFDFTLTK